MSENGWMMLMRSGDIGALLLLLLALLAVVSSLLCGVFALMGRRVPAVIWYACPALIVIWAEMYTGYGFYIGHGAVVLAAEETRATLAAAAYGMGLPAMGLGYLLFGLTMVWSSIWAAASCVRLKEPGGTWKPLRTVGMMMVWLLATGVALCTPIFASTGLTNAAMLMGLFLLTWMLLGLRDTEHLGERDRLMFARGLTVWMVAAGCLAFAFSAHGFGQSSVYSAIANAPPDYRSVLVAVGNANMLAGIWTGIGAMVVALVMGLVAFGRHIRVGANSSDLIKAVLMIGLVGIWVVCFLSRVFLGAQLFEFGQ